MCSIWDALGAFFSVTGDLKRLERVFEGFVGGLWGRKGFSRGAREGA